MKKQIMLMMVAVSMLFSQPLFARPIDCRPVAKHQKGHTRTGNPEVSASIEQNVISVEIDKYVGRVFVKIVDTNRNIVNTITGYINGHGTLDLSIDNISSDFYILNLVLDDVEYEGTFKSE